MTDTIFALSSGAPPAAIAVVRISGPHASHALAALTGKLPPPRRAITADLQDASGETLDRALILWLPGPGTATGEDTAELHCHGGRAVITGVEDALSAMPELRRATSGEFTRRAFAHGKIDLAQAEGLADLLAAETELQRRCAQAMAGGSFSRRIEAWRESLLALSAALEAVLDFSDDDDVSGLPADFSARLGALRRELAEWVSRPRAEALREGFRCVLAGPPNSGKSTLFNALIEEEAAIVAPVAGTTRDVLVQSVAIEGVPFRFADTAGLRGASGDPIEAIGIERAHAAMDDADLVLWLGPEGECEIEGSEGAWEIEPQADRADHPAKVSPRHRVSAVSGEGIDALRRDLVARARAALPRSGMAALNARQHRLLTDAERALSEAGTHHDLLLAAESLRVARLSFDALLGRTTTEDMLDALFGRFCIGK